MPWAVLWQIYSVTQYWWDGTDRAIISLLVAEQASKILWMVSKYPWDSRNFPSGDADTTFDAWEGRDSPSEGFHTSYGRLGWRYGMRKGKSVHVPLSWEMKLKHKVILIVHLSLETQIVPS